MWLFFILLLGELKMHTVQKQRFSRCCSISSTYPCKLDDSGLMVLVKKRWHILVYIYHKQFEIMQKFNDIDNAQTANINCKADIDLVRRSEPKT